MSPRAAVAPTVRWRSHSVSAQISPSAWTSKLGWPVLASTRPRSAYVNPPGPVSAVPGHDAEVAATGQSIAFSRIPVAVLSVA